MAWAFNRGMFDAVSGNVWGTIDARVGLLVDGFTPNRDADFVSDIVANEIATTNYARQVLTGEVITLDDANDRVLLDADNAVFPSLGPASGGPTVGSAFVYRNTGADGTSPLWMWMDATPTDVNGSDFTYQWAAVGLAVLTS